MKLYALFLGFLLVFFTSSCTTSNTNDQQVDGGQLEKFEMVKHPEWSKNASIYEVNIRQYTAEGTFKAFETHLPRLKELGVDILWFMPIQPIGEKNRKGSKGSYYSVKDYKSVNPEFGTMDEFKALVQKIHSMDMYIILDWVANHSAWDNQLTVDHPDWYTRNYKGEFQPTPGYDWSDVIDFDYEKQDLQDYMIDALKFWVEEADVDGYRCDVAGFVPLEFWNKARAALDKIKPVFMLAEWESRDLHQHAFDMTYAWKFYDIMHHIAKGDVDAGKMRWYFAHENNSFPPDGYRMYFVDNHDKNSWDGTMFSQFGDALEVAIVLTATVEGMPLIYTGQEAGMDKQLAFFEKDEVEWKAHPIGDLYKQLLAIKKQQRALWNGNFGGRMHFLDTDKPKSIYAFVRIKEDSKVFVVCNLSDRKQTFKMEGNDIYTGEYDASFSGDRVRISEGEEISLDAWGYEIFIK